MTADDLRRAFRPRSRYYPAPSLVCVENTHNGAGGKITDIVELRLSASKPDRGIARIRQVTINQRGEQVMEQETTVFLKRRPVPQLVPTLLPAYLRRSRRYRPRCR